MKNCKLMSRIAALFLALLVFVPPAALAVDTVPADDSTPAATAEIVTENSRELLLSPRYEYLTRIACGLTISSKGTATCSGQYTNYLGYGGTLTLQLQQFSSGRWTTIESWSKDYSTDGAKLYSENYDVAKGYQYRVIATVALKDSDCTVLETAACDSPVKEY